MRQKNRLIRCWTSLLDSFIILKLIVLLCVITVYRIPLLGRVRTTVGNMALKERNAIYSDGNKDDDDETE
jgi:hypothetical protein